jgi:predicted dinucleotide-binding enzyme
MRIASSLALAAMVAVPAIAAPTVTGEAVVQWKHGAQDKIIVDETVWRCQGTTCSGQLAENGHSVARACRQVARFAGLVQSFRTPAQTLDEQELSRCNRGR